MNAHSTIPAGLRLDSGLIQAVIAKATALLRNPERDSSEHMALLVAVDTLDGHGELAERIADQKYDLRGEVACLACGQDACGCDAAHDARSEWGMTSYRTASGGYGVAA